MFRDKVTLLDFDMEEIRRLRPLIEWLKLQDRYLSNSVEEDSFIVGDLKNPISTPNRDLKRKAYHITRVAATFNSPRFEDDPIGLYEQLRTMKVVEVDRISSVLKIFQNKQPFEVHVATANEHIDDSTGGSRFMSRKIVERKSSVSVQSFPGNSSLIDGPIETEAVKALTAIFATERFVLDDVLDDQGILQVSFEDEDGESYSSETEEYQEEEDQEEESQQQGSSDSELETDDTLSEQLTPSHSSTNAGTLPDAELSETMREEGLHETLTEVFELLSCLNMPNWDRANWQSTIRSYVTIHPDYRDLQAWRGHETADLVYSDDEGHLTNTLIGCGYLDHDEWYGERPKYYIEVKTTTGPCSTAFYMSGKQYKLMQRVHQSDDHSEIYMVFRVFWLDSDDISLCLYIDPEQLRQDESLLFKGQAWTVTPGPSMG
ncbi:hypothetical protein ACHAPM_004575 [Fusarium culmorum]